MLPPIATTEVQREEGPVGEGVLIRAGEAIPTGTDEREHMTTMLPPATERKTEYPAVKCPSCGRYCGAYVGKSQCPSCKRWVDSGRMPD